MRMRTCPSLADCVHSTYTRTHQPGRRAGVFPGPKSMAANGECRVSSADCGERKSSVERVL